MTSPITFISGMKNFKRGSVTIVSSGDTQYAVATQVTASIPASAPGDVLFAFVMHRSALATPAGWELLLTLPNLNSSQFHSIFKRNYQVGDTFCQFNQSSAVRMGAHVLSVRSSTGSLVVVDVESKAVEDSSMTIPVPPAQVARNGLFLASATSLLAVLPPDPTLFETSPGWLLSSEASALENRLCVAWRQVASGEIADGSISTFVEPAPNYMTGITLVLIAN